MRKFVKEYLLTMCVALFFVLTHTIPAIPPNLPSEPVICTMDNLNPSYYPLDDDSDIIPL